MNSKLLTQLLQISRQMAETRDIDQLLALAMARTVEVVRAELCYLILLRADGELDFRVRSTVNDAAIANDNDELSRSIFDQVVRTGSPIVVSDALSDEYYASKSSIINLHIRSVMCVPLIAGGTVLGAIYVENRKISGAFREDDLQPLIFFANQAAVAIENSMIIASLEERVAARTAQLEASWREAIEANKMRTIFLGQLAHDMRTPATVIKFALSSLRNPKVGDLNPNQEKWVNRAIDGADQMNSLIANIFDLSKVELNALEIYPELISLKPFLQRIHEIGQALPWSEHVQFNLELPESLPEMTLDKVRIQQVLMNLISNALKFTTQGEVCLYARVPESDHVEIGVRDTGEGIPEQLQPYLFERFRQFDADLNRKVKGAGLGLAICRELVEKHGGRIRVSSTPNQGSNFAFTLPIANSV